MTRAYMLALVPLSMWAAYGIWMAVTDPDPYTE